MKATTSKPVAVLISDIHFTVSTLELATAALKQAKSHAIKLGVPLILAGDTTDSKAIIRAEVANRLIEVLDDGRTTQEVYILVGNHDMLNEKGGDHALHFLEPYAVVVDSVVDVEGIGRLIPYQSDAADLQTILNMTPKGSRIIMHQGVQGAFMGHYLQDKTSLPPEAFADFRVISGHYHRAQDIKCGRPRKGAVGLFSYIGNPYSLTFAEASDGPKGFRVLHEDGSLVSVPTNLRKHVVLEWDVGTLGYHIDTEGASKPFTPQDLVWFKISGPTSLLGQLKKSDLGDFVGHLNFKLDRLYTDAPKLEQKADKMTGEQMLDGLIDQTDETPTQKEHLKKVWRELMS